MCILNRSVLRELLFRVYFIVENVRSTPVTVEKHHIGLNTRVRQKHTTRQTKYRMHIKTLKQFFFHCLKRLVCLKQHTLRNDHTTPALKLEVVHHVLEEQKLCRIGLYGEVLLYLLFLFPTKRRVRQYAVITVFLL